VDFILEALQLAFIGMTVVLIFLTVLMYVVAAIGKLLPPDAQPVAAPRAVAGSGQAASSGNSDAVAAAISIAVALYRQRQR
jgi:sodium pump decarboxylase gamma subunit